MLLRAVGNKAKVVKSFNLCDHFPVHDMFIDMFFRAGGVFFNKPKAKYNICNDKDSDVYNLFTVVSTRKSELEAAVFSMPIHDDLFQYWRRNGETDPIQKALRFLFLSNFSFMAMGQTMSKGFVNTKKLLYENIDQTSKFIFDVQFLNADFRKVLPQISFKNQRDKDRCFIYADPPYLGTNNNYAADCQFTPQDLIDLFEVLVGSGIKFALSEFENPTIIEMVNKYNLNLIEIGERQNLGNRRTEILVTNYSLPTQY